VSPKIPGNGDQRGKVVVELAAIWPPRGLSQGNSHVQSLPRYDGSYGVETERFGDSAGKIDGLDLT
jgi:hypothetical protein